MAVPMSAANDFIALSVEKVWRSVGGASSSRLRHANRTSRGASREQLLRDRGIHPAGLHYALRWPEAQIIHVIGDVGPSVHHARRDDHDVADLHDDLLHGIRHPATGRPVWSSLGVLSVVPSVDDVAVREHRSAAGGDDIAFGLEIVSDASRRSAR